MRSPFPVVIDSVGTDVIVRLPAWVLARGDAGVHAAEGSYSPAIDGLRGIPIPDDLRAKLAMYGGHITKAAEESGIPRQHFSLLMKRYLGREE